MVFLEEKRVDPLLTDLTARLADLFFFLSFFFAGIDDLILPPYFLRYFLLHQFCD